MFDIVQDGNVTAGVVPFENSSNGSVVFALDDLADREGRYQDISVVGEIYVDVHHCLLGHKAAEGGSNNGSGVSTPTPTDPQPSRPRAKPLGDLSHIERLYSHPQAFGQCTAFISAYLKGVEVFEVSSTSKAAEIVSRDKSGTWAAISSELAAGLTGLDFLAKSIEDRSDNTTRFLVISKTRSSSSNTTASPPTPSASQPNPAAVDEWVSKQRRRRQQQQQKTPTPTPTPADAASDAGSNTKSLVSFTVPHDSPGALAEVLSCFRAFNLNLTSINSRPSLEKPFQYIFFIEFEGHRNRDPEGRVRGALDKIDKVAASWRWLGSWERAR